MSILNLTQKQSSRLFNYTALILVLAGAMFGVFGIVTLIQMNASIIAVAAVIAPTLVAVAFLANIVWDISKD